MGDRQVFREDFTNTNTTTQNGGTINNSPTINKGVTLNGTTQNITYSDPFLGIKTVKITLEATTTTEDIMNLDSGTHTIEVGAGTVTATGFSSPTIYVDGVASSTLTTAKSTIVITTDTAFDATALDIGKETTYFDGVIYRVELYTEAWSAETVLDDFENDTYNEVDANKAAVYLPLRSRFNDGSNEVTENLGTSLANAIVGDGSTSTTFPTFLNPHGANLDGGDYLYLTNSNKFEFDNDEPFSLVVAVKDMIDDGSGDLIVAKTKAGFLTVGSNGSEGFDLLFNGGIAQFRVRDSNDAASLATGTQSIVGGTHVIVATFDWVNSKIYIDGILDDTTTAASMNGDLSPESGNLVLGAYQTLNGGYLKGSILDFYLFPQALTSRQARWMTAYLFNKLNV